MRDALALSLRRDEKEFRVVGAKDGKYPARTERPAGKQEQAGRQNRITGIQCTSNPCLLLNSRLGKYVQDNHTGYDKRQPEDSGASRDCPSTSHAMP
jgi:hypothetical protein